MFGFWHPQIFDPYRESTLGQNISVFVLKRLLDLRIPLPKRDFELSFFKSGRLQTILEVLRTHHDDWTSWYFMTIIKREQIWWVNHYYTMSSLYFNYVQSIFKTSIVEVTKHDVWTVFKFRPTFSIPCLETTSKTCTIDGTTLQEMVQMLVFTKVQFFLIRISPMKY